MKGMGGQPGEECPFTINYDPATFKPGDLISYRVPESFGDTPFLGEIVAVEPHSVLLRHYDAAGSSGDVTVMRGTRERHPSVSDSEALGD